MEKANSSLESVVDVHIISVGEELAGRRISEVREEVARAMEEGRRNLILDCRELGFVNSEGLELLLWVIEEVQNRGGLVKIASLGRIPQKVFELTQFDRIFEFYDDVISALKSL